MEPLNAVSGSEYMLQIEPVAIWEGCAQRILNTVEEASRYLAEDWPGDRNATSYSVACEACLAAFEDNATADQARPAIIKAARDAGILVEIQEEDSPEKEDGEPLSLF
jgi:hypothetical protein